MPMNDFRPDPDALLQAIQKNEARQQRGKFKIFLGMVAGVGKTYAMLDSAQAARAEGVDVVVGYVETHRRAETDSLLSGLEVIVRQAIEYRGVTLTELDTDAVLARHPQLVLVDELAHHNAPGLRHAKRYQDIIELLEAGIDVWTTVNVQHFESRADSVRQITGITVHETVPDTLLDLADEIELVDLSPEDLRKRLAEGKVYTPERVEVAASSFFRTGNLTALREMALRLAAEHVDHKLRDYMQTKRIAGPWKSGERLMVAVGPSPFSEQLIRWTRRMAYNLEASWTAVYIKTSQALSEAEQQRLTHNLDLARSLGGEIVTSAGDDVTEALLQVARQRNITQIVVGKPNHSLLQRLWRGRSLVDQLIHQSGDIDIYVVTSDKLDRRSTGPLTSSLVNTHSSWYQYGLALLLVGLVTVVDLTLHALWPWISYQAVGLTELLAVLLIAIYLGRGPALLAAAASAISWNYLFIEPRLTFTISQVDDIILFVLYFLIALFTGNLTARIRAQERQARYNAERTTALYALAHETATAVNLNDVLRTAVTQINTVFDAEVGMLLTTDGRLNPQPHPGGSLHVDEKDYSVARWAFERGRPAGRFTDTLPMATAQFLPLRTPNRTVGVIGIRTRQNERLPFDQDLLLQTFASQVALTIERELLDEAAQRAALHHESERLYTTLLNSISHELRTPIATIAGASSSLLDPQTGTNETARHELAQDIQTAAERLNRLVENLLDMSRLESGRLQLKRDWCDIGDILGAAVKRVSPCLADHPFHIQVAPDLPLIRVDFVLIEQAFINLLDNICNYTPPGTSASVTAWHEAQVLRVIVADQGPGIPEADLERVFDKFYRLPGTASGGTGLGLAICRGIFEVHGGTLTARHALEGGLQLCVELPVDDNPPPVQEASL